MDGAVLDEAIAGGNNAGDDEVDEVDDDIEEEEEDDEDSEDENEHGGDNANENGNNGDIIEGGIAESDEPGKVASEADIVRVKKQKQNRGVARATRYLLFVLFSMNSSP